MRNILIVLFAMVFVMSFANAQTGSVAISDAQFQVTMLGGGITIDAQDGVIENLAPGYTYTADPLAALGGYGGTGIWTGVSPLIRGDETYSQGMQFIVTVGNDGNYDVSFVLPTELSESGVPGGSGLGFAPMPCSFGARAGYNEMNTTYFNPNVTNVMWFQGGISANLDLGITVTTPAVAPVDDVTWVGSVVCTVAITGL